jgi:hypothetical protein
MTQRIYKFPLKLAVNQKIWLTPDTEILKIDKQSGVIHLWAIVDIEQAPAERIIHMVGTGDKPASDTYLGTVVTDDGHFVWHFFDGGWA